VAWRVLEKKLSFILNFSILLLKPFLNSKLNAEKTLQLSRTDAKIYSFLKGSNFSTATFYYYYRRGLKWRSGPLLQRSVYRLFKAQLVDNELSGKTAPRR